MKLKSLLHRNAPLFSSRRRLPLGRKVSVPQRYSPDVLFRVRRKTPVEFGYDCWKSHEFVVKIGGELEFFLLNIRISSSSKYYPESKSMKLYLNSFRNEEFGSQKEVISRIRFDLEALIEDEVALEMRKWKDVFEFLHLKNEKFATFYPLLTYCPVTHQPDFAAVVVRSSGKCNEQFKSVFRSAVLKLQGRKIFQEEAASWLFLHLKEALPCNFAIALAYTRRGGISITPVRASSSLVLDEMMNEIDVCRKFFLFQ